MTCPPDFPPTPAAFAARLAAVRPADYAGTRNALDGAVTRLSPYITHGFASLPDVLADVARRHAMAVDHRFVFELGWREYFRHAWQHRQAAIFRSIHAGPLPEDAYAGEMPHDIVQARTGVPAIDHAVRELYASGWLHNHARLWLASYIVHLRKVHWRVGADWLYGHLLDGDLGSNHLSWQWVAGTGSHKPYLFNAANVARHAPADWHSADTAIDLSYDALDQLARSRTPVPERPAGDGVAQPPLSGAPPADWAPTQCEPPEPQLARGRDVWLVHPWALRPAPPDLPPDVLQVGVCLTDFHAAWPWSAMRWRFVGARLAALAPTCWVGDTTAVARALRGARTVQAHADPHVDPLGHLPVTWRPAAKVFRDLDRLRPSFSAWWRDVTSGVDHLGGLPGLGAGRSHVGERWHA